MPVCGNCGHRVAFVHRIRGTETRLYDAAGNYDGSEYQQFETVELWCADCESRDVVVE